MYEKAGGLLLVLKRPSFFLSSANFQRTQFVLYDSRGYNKHAPSKGLKELAAVTYVSNLPASLQKEPTHSLVTLH
jgi:hypothetical protein